MTDDELPLAGTEVHRVRSEHVGDDFLIHVGDCGALEEPGAVLFLGDAFVNFGLAVDIVRLLRFSEIVPPMLVVAIGYPAPLETVGTRRCRDFTPTITQEYGSAHTAMMGGADRFLAFLRDELKPWVRERYGADPDDSMLFGYSLGGLFATHALLTDPAAFRRYGLGSPSLWWDDGVMLRRAVDYGSAQDDLPARVYVSVGGYETPAGFRGFLEQLPTALRERYQADAAADPPVDLVGAVEGLVETLRAGGYPSLQLDFEVLAGEYHDTAPPLSLSRAVRHLFDAPR